MRVAVAYGAVLAVFLISGCANDPKAANADNFARVIAQEYASSDKSLICNNDSLPATVELTDETYYKKISALQDAKIITLSAPRPSYQIGSRAVTYTFNKNAKSLGVTYSPGVDENFYINMCPIRVTLDHVINFTEPADQLGMTITNVKYSLKVIESQPWLTNHAMNAEFNLSSLVDNAKQPETKTLELTNTGWQDVQQH